MFCVFCLILISIWEENEYTKLKKKYWNQDEVEPEIITIKIKKSVVKKEWKDIMKKLTTNEFIERSRRLHGEKYDYSRSIYVDRKTKINIICPIHGIFNQDIYSHLYGYECDKCGGTYKLNTEEFINRAKDIHGNLYNYSKTNYDGMSKKLKIICLIHGEFLQKAQGHLLGKGCRKCKYDKHKVLTRSNIKEFSKKASKIHFKKYNYTNSNYVNSNTKIDILCNKCNKIFNQSPHDHLDGHGCPYCPHHISKPEIKFLDLLKITQRQKHICGYKVDGIKGNKIYEFLGNYYHGNPKIYKSKEYNQICHKTFGELYNNTQKKLILLKNKGYKVYYIWEKDWNDWNGGIIKTMPIKLVS